MEENRTTNSVVLCGSMAGRPELSHESRGERFYRFPLEVSRLSGAVDRINIILREGLADFSPDGWDKLRISGEVRSFNNKYQDGPKLVITVFAKEIVPCCGDDENTVELLGTICKEPTLRSTPMGREICDIMLAVNRRYGRSDYLPCIAWGLNARRISRMAVGDMLEINGRIQSRKYTKILPEGAFEKTAYEISVISFESLTY